jgi:DNA repair protein RadC
VTPPRSFYLSELEIRRKRVVVACDAVPSWDKEQAFIRPSAIAEVFCQVIGTGLVREHFVVFMLDARNRLIGFEITNVGLETHVETSPSAVFRAALLSGAVGVILAHNHPSGDPTPSSGDVLVTGLMIKAGELLGIPVLDHVVVTDEHCVSINEYVQRGGL